MAPAIRSFLFLLAPVIIYADTGIVSLRPLYTPETAVSNPALVGLWTEEHGDYFRVTFRVEPDGQSGYRVAVGNEEVLTFHLVQLGGETVADIVFEFPNDFRPHLSVHYFARLRVEGNTLQVDALGGEKLLQRIEQRGSPRFERLTEGDWDGTLILPASTAELRQFVLDCLKQPDGFGSDSEMTDTFERAGPEEIAADLNGHSWNTVSSSGGHPEAYAIALQQAQEAVSLVSGEPDYWTTLGAAQYRVGLYSEALKTLARAGELRKSASIEDLIFRAMSHQQAGQKEEAKAILLGDLAKVLGDPRYSGDLQRYCGEQDKRSLLREAENLIMPKGK